jgi:hypothetical protein
LVAARRALLLVAIAAAFAGLASCSRTAERARDVGNDFHCPPERPQSYDFCGLPDAVASHADARGCTPWPNRPPNLWMSFCCPEPEDDTGIGLCK